MADVPRVPLGRPPAGSWLPGVATGTAVVLGLMILKPWAPAAPTATAAPLPTFRVGPVRTQPPFPQYDPRLFGFREPDPAWELWPAGYVVRFGMAGPVRVQGHDDSGLPAGSPAPGESAAPSAVSSPAAPSASPSLPTNVVDIGPADHLVALGINTPREARIELVRLWWLEDGKPPYLVPIVRLPTLWESDHFIVIAPEHPDVAGQPFEWEPGLYRLDLTNAAMEVREVYLLVGEPLD